MIDNALRVADWVKLSQDELALLSGMLDLPWGEDGFAAIFALQDRYSEANPYLDGSPPVWCV